MEPGTSVKICMNAAMVRCRALHEERDGTLDNVKDLQCFLDSNPGADKILRLYSNTAQAWIEAWESNYQTHANFHLATTCINPPETPKVKKAKKCDKDDSDCEEDDENKDICDGKEDDDLTECEKWRGKDCSAEEDDDLKEDCEDAQSAAKVLMASLLTMASLVSLM